MDRPATDGPGAVRKRDDGVIGGDLFLHVKHDPQPAPNYLKQCEGKKVTSILDPQLQCKLAKLVLAHGTSDPNRDNIRLNFGFTSDQSCNERNEDGITKPVLKKPPSSVTNLCQEAMASFSCFALSSYKAGKEVEWTKLQERREQFAETMHKASIFEAYCFALVPVNDCFALHEDGKNCKSSTSKLLTQVCCYSAYVSIEEVEYRLSIIGYSRESITYHLDRKVLFVDIISDVCAFYKGCANTERCVNDCRLGFEYLHQNPSGQDEFPRRLECCHFNKDVFYSTFTHVISVLSHLGKGLNIDQRRGLWLASVFGNNPIHFWEFGQLCGKDDVQVEFRKLEGWQIASAFLSFLIGTRKLVKLLQRWRPCAISTKPSARAKDASRGRAKGASRGRAKDAKDAHPVLTKAAPMGEDKVLTESMAMELLEQLETNDWQNLDDVPQFCRLFVALRS